MRQNRCTNAEGKNSAAQHKRYIPYHIPYPTSKLQDVSQRLAAHFVKGTNMIHYIKDIKTRLQKVVPFLGFWAFPHFLLFNASYTYQCYIIIQLTFLLFAKRKKKKEIERIFTLDSPDKWGRVVLEPVMVQWVVPQVGDWSWQKAGLGCQALSWWWCCCYLQPVHSCWVVVVLLEAGV